MTDESPGKRPIERIELDRLYDIKKAIEEIQDYPRFSEGKSAWDEDKIFRIYCERLLAIIGEAASKLASEHDYETKAPEIPWASIKGLRNVLVHVYWKADKEILWTIIDEHVPPLKEMVDKWIEEKERILKERPELDIKKSEKKESKLFRRIREMTDKEQSQTDDQG